MSNGVIIISKYIKVTKISSNVFFATPFNHQICPLIVNLIIKCVFHLPFRSENTFRNVFEVSIHSETIILTPHNTFIDQNTNYLLTVCKSMSN
jgi:hypothetical protein